MLGDDVSDSVTVVVLFALLGVGAGRGTGFAVKQDVAAIVAGRLEGGLDQVHETDVDDGQFKLDVSKVTG